MQQFPVFRPQTISHQTAGTLLDVSNALKSMTLNASALSKTKIVFKRYKTDPQRVIIVSSFSLFAWSWGHIPPNVKMTSCDFGISLFKTDNTLDTPTSAHNSAWQIYLQFSVDTHFWNKTQKTFSYQRQRSAIKSLVRKQTPPPVALWLVLYSMNRHDGEKSGRRRRNLRWPSWQRCREWIWKRRQGDFFFLQQDKQYCSQIFLCARCQLQARISRDECC